ncbi:MAG: LysM peptidoglycan-binding domain-containing protein [Planctomycetota bacterium]
MGKIEKLVVLAVLFVSAIVVAVSLHGGGEPTSEQQPFGAAEVAGSSAESAGESATSADGKRSWIRDEVWNERPADRVTGRRSGSEDRADAPSDGPSSEPASSNSVSSIVAAQRAADLLLSASGANPAPSSARVPAPTPAPAPFDAEGRPRILRSDADVRDLGIDSLRAYTVARGDTWTSLSERFFVGGTRHRELFQRQNETVTDLTAGQVLAVPVYDLFSGSGEREPFEARPVRVSTDASTEAPATGSTAATSSTDDGWYVVTSGDTLSDISMAVYGTSTRWREIYEANRSRLAGPDWLDVGVRLRIP